MLRDLTPRRAVGVALLLSLMVGAGMYTYTQWLEPMVRLLEALDEGGWGRLYRTEGWATGVRCVLDSRCAPLLSLLPRYVTHHPPMPSSWLGYGALGVLLWAAVMMRPNRQPPTYRDDWAGPRDYAPLRVRHFTNLSSALGLAQVGRSLLALRARDPRRAMRELGHVLVVGPTRSGKGLGLITNLLCWTHSAVVLDITGQLHRVTAMRRSILGRVWVLDPDSGTGHQYDPFADLAQTETGIQSAATIIMRPERDNQPIFAQRALYLLCALIRMAQIERRAALHVIREHIRGVGLHECMTRLAHYPDARVRADVRDFVGTDLDRLPSDLSGDRFLTSAWGTLKARLTPYFSDSVLRMLGGSDFTASDLVRTPSTLYLRFGETEGEATQDVLALVVLGLVTGLMRDADRTPDAQRVPLLLALDEAGRTPLPRLTELIATVSGRGISIALYVQSLAQLEAVYGRAGAQTIRDNCHTQVYYRPTDIETARAISAVLGERSVPDVRESRQTVSPLVSRDSTSQGQQRRALLTPTEVLRMPDGEVVVLSAGRRPIRATRLSWLDHPQLQRWARLAPPALTPLPPAPPLATDRVGTPTAPEETPSPTPAYLEPTE